MAPPPKGNHVWLASYPKSGNTWMRLALTSLRQGGEMIHLSDLPDGGISLLARRYLFDETLGIDSADLSFEEVLQLRPKLYPLLHHAPERLEIWKTHDAWEINDEGDPLFPAEITAAALYLVRDPRDVAISFAHHMNCGIDQTIERMVRSRRPAPGGGGLQVPQFLSSWNGHVESWLDRSGLSPLIIRYEDMVADLGSVLTRVAAALGWPAEPAAIYRAVEATHFDRLRAQEEQDGFAEAPAKSVRFFRNGKVGAWRDGLTSAQAARIERDHGAVMSRLGYL